MYSDVGFYGWTLPKPVLQAPTVPYAPLITTSRSTVYQALNASRREIRLLEIPLLPDSRPISCNLITVSLDDKPEYAALSYVWGDPTDTEYLELNGQRFSATKSLISALYQFRAAARDSGYGGHGKAI
jgi:hypothetical protein